MKFKHSHWIKTLVRGQPTRPLLCSECTQLDCAKPTSLVHGSVSDSSLTLYKSLPGGAGIIPRAKSAHQKKGSQSKKLHSEETRNIKINQISEDVVTCQTHPSPLHPRTNSPPVYISLHNKNMTALCRLAKTNRCAKY